MTAYIFDTQSGRAFYQLMKSEYSELCAVEIVKGPEALAANIANLITELPYNYPCRDIDVRHFTALAADKAELSSVASQIAAALLQNVGTDKRHSKVKKSK